MSKGKGNYVEPYIKENNLIQLSLFYFGRKKIKRIIVKWEDKNGSYSLKCVCDEGLPGSREQDCYTAAMRIWVRQNMPREGIELNYSDIARELKLKNVNHSSVQIKQSLKRLGAARYEFVQCFIKANQEGRKKITTQFSLFDSTSLFEYEKGKSKRKSTSLLIFPEIIRSNLEEKYYQYLDMAWYRNLPEGLPRRLYEFLEKRRYHEVDGVFIISEEALCRWLPINDKHVTNRRKRIKEITAPLVEKGFLSEYKFDLEKKYCVFTYAKNSLPPKEENTTDVGELLDISLDEICPVESNSEQNKNENHEIEELLSLINTDDIPQKLKKEIKKYWKAEGADYVKWNILYANKNSKKRYSTYLQKALSENWGEEYKEEVELVEQKSMKIQKEYEENYEEKKTKSKEIEDLKEGFREEVKKLDLQTKQGLMEKAEENTPNNMLGRSMNVKIEYCKLLLFYINENTKKSFPESVVTELGFVKKIAVL